MIHSLRFVERTTDVGNGITKTEKILQMCPHIAVREVGSLEEIWVDVPLIQE